MDPDPLYELIGEAMQESPEHRLGMAIEGAFSAFDEIMAMAADPKRMSTKSETPATARELIATDITEEVLSEARVLIERKDDFRLPEAAE